MNTAGDFPQRARLALQHARESLDQNVTLSITRSEEATEYALKAVLMIFGVNYPRDHGVHQVLGTREVYDRFPEWFQRQIPRLVMLSLIFSQLRIFARYGNERLGTPPNDIFTQHEAEVYLEDAEEVVETCERLFAELNPSEA